MNPPQGGTTSAVAWGWIPSSEPQLCPRSGRHSIGRVQELGCNKVRPSVSVSSASMGVLPTIAMRPTAAGLTPYRAHISSNAARMASRVIRAMRAAFSPDSPAAIRRVTTSLP